MPAQAVASVIIASHGDGTLLRGTLSSVVKQTCSGIDIIVVNHGQDETVSAGMPEDFADPRIRIVRQQPGTKLAQAWNAGVAQASSAYVCCLEAGQELEHTYLEKALFVLETSQIDICVSPRGCSAESLPRLGAFSLRQLLAEGDSLATAAVFRKKLWSRVHGYDSQAPPACESWDLWIRMAKAGARAHCLRELSVRGCDDALPADRNAAIESLRSKHADLYGNPKLVRKLTARAGESLVASYAALLESSPIPNRGRAILVAMPALTVGGAEASISQICRQLQRSGFQVFVVTTTLPPDSRGDTSRWFEEGATGIYPLPRFLETWRWAGFIYYLLQRHSIDILWQVGSSYVYDLVPDIKQYLPGITIVDLLFNEVGHTENYLKHKSLIDHVVTEHPGMKAWLAQHGENEDKISVIANGVDLEKFSPQSEEFAANGGETLKRPRIVIAFFGRLSEEKGPDLFIEIASRLSSRRDLDFLVCGIGELYSQLLACTQAKRLEERVRFAGFVDTREYLARCDVVVVCSRMDGRPNIVMEAAAMGIPVVASRVGGIPEMVLDGMTGKLCEAGDVAGFCAAILELADHPDQRRNMGHSALAWAEEHFSIRHTAESYADLFERLVWNQTARAHLQTPAEPVPLHAMQPKPYPVSRGLLGPLRTLLMLLSVSHARATLRNALLWLKVRASREHAAQLDSLFDPEYYLTAYPDVATAGVPPLLHYMLRGFLELRNPGPQFDTGDYLRHHPDVWAERVNPLLHYILWGRHEGRVSASQIELRSPDAQPLTSNFLPELLLEIFSSLSRVQLRNIDYWRYPELEPKGIERIRAWWTEQCLAIANRLRLSQMAQFPRGHATTTLLGILNRLSDYQRTHELLDTEASRTVMIKVLAFRVLSNRYVKLPQNQPLFWKLRRRLETGECRDRSVAPMRAGGFVLPMFDLLPLGFPVRLHAHPMNILNTFMLKQYDSRAPEISVHAGPGDIVIDGGACWGDTSLYFACRCGEEGRVFAFEILPENLAILEQNLKRNPTLHRRIEPVRQALWDRSGESLNYTSRASGTSLLVGDRRDGSVETITIDAFVEQHGLPRVDFIKLDVEGAELKALRGAENTLRTFKPRLAVSVYHQEDDLLSIPQYLHGLNCGYKLVLDHFTIYNEETVLFAAVQP